MTPEASHIKNNHAHTYVKNKVERQSRWVNKKCATILLIDLSVNQNLIMSVYECEELLLVIGCDGQGSEWRKRSERGSGVPQAKLEAKTTRKQGGCPTTASGG